MVNKMTFIAKPGKQEIHITREFDAPRELVFKAYIDKTLYPKWATGPKDYTMKLEKFEPKSGGQWKYIHRDQKGNEFKFHGVYHEVLPPERMIDTFEYDGLPEKGHVAIETANFLELPNGRSKLEIHTVFQSVDDRDGMINSGMKEGMNESFDRLEELLITLQK